MKKELFKKNIAVLGFGVEGQDLVSFLSQNGADKITVFDQRQKGELVIDGEKFKGIRFICGKNYLSQGLTGFDIIFRSPGVYRYSPELVAAEKKGVLISSQTKLFFDLCPARIIGVTGTKGKGTTSTLIYKILQRSGINTYLAGNIGLPPLGLLKKIRSDDWVVLELSSFQLIDLTKSPNIAVVTNISSDHMDWHADHKEYVDAKSKIISNQLIRDSAVLNFDNKISKSFSKDRKARIYFFSAKKKLKKGAYFDSGNLYLVGFGSNPSFLVSSENIFLKGMHNVENILAASLAARLAGAKIKAIRKAIVGFKGLPHRLERVKKIGGVTFYNDSFATNPEPTIAAINSFLNEKLILILGGRDKGLDFSKLGKTIFENKNIKTILLIGEVRNKIKMSIKKWGYQGKIIDMGKGTFGETIKRAYNEALPDEIVILSPAATSFDMFKDYKERGDLFKKEVGKLNEKD